MNKRIVWRATRIRSLLLFGTVIFFPLASSANETFRIHPSATALAEKCMSINMAEREEALSYLVNNVTSDVQIEAVLDIIDRNIDTAPRFKPTTRKEQVRNVSAESHIQSYLLKMDHFKAKCFVFKRVFLKENRFLDTGYVLSDIHELNGIVPGTNVNYQILRSSKVISGKDVIEIIVSDCFDYYKDNINYVSTILSHLLIQKYKRNYSLNEKEAREAIVAALTNVDAKQLDPSRKKLVDEIAHICKDVEYKMRKPW